MGRWLARRVVQAALTLAVAVTLAFVLMRVAPGDPLARLAMDQPISPQQIALLRTRYGLDQPLLKQYTAFVGGALHGDFGVSIAYGRPVTALIAERLPATLILGGTVLLINFTLGLWLGVRQAVKRGRAADHLIGVLSQTGYAVPSFWLGLVLAWLVGIRWQLLPAGGMHSPLMDPTSSLLHQAADLLEHLILPALTLSIVSIAAAIRYQRTAMLDALSLPFILTARAKGLRERQIVWRHAWRNALFPVLTLFGLWLPVLVTGSVFVEDVFAWPGLGSLAAGAVAARDYPVLMGTTTLVAVIVVLASLLIDGLYALLDPRIRWA